jgi:hypothetical protein
MRSNSKVRRAAMAALVAAALVVGAGQVSADVSRFPVDGGGRGNSTDSNSPRSLKRPHKGALSLVTSSLRSLFTRYWDADGTDDVIDVGGTQRMPVVRGPRLW